MSISSNPKYLQILHTGRKLFWKFGFKRVSIEEICKEAGVSKMTFYKHFPNKLELLKVVFDEIFEQALEKFSVLEDKSIAADDKLKLIISLKSSGISGISQELMKDLYGNPDPGPRRLIQDLSEKWLKEINRIFEGGKKDGWLRKDINIPFYFHLAQKMGELIADESLQAHFSNPEDVVMEVTNMMVYGIGPRNK